VTELDHIHSDRSIRIDQSKFSGETSIYIADQVALLTRFEREPAAINKDSLGWRRTALDVGCPCVEASVVVPIYFEHPNSPNGFSNISPHARQRGNIPHLATAMTRNHLPQPFHRPLFKAFLLVWVSIGLLNAQQSSEPQFVFDTGEPAWAGERIELPPSFAPSLGWKGVEQIRFAPGMFQAEAKGFFSYVLVFLLEPEAETSEAALKRELLTYYKGLSEAVMKGKSKTVNTSTFSLSLTMTDALEDAPAKAMNVTAYTAILKWIEPFATQKSQALQFEIHCWEHLGQPVVLSCVSPLERDQTVWTQLRDIRKKFHFTP
jgi:hypothetical protein